MVSYEPAPATVTPADARSTTAASELLARLRASLAGRYAVERRVGEGGMALVYLAQDLVHPRAVAIKVLRPELASAIGSDRFLREIALASRLQHPNILGLYESGESDGFIYYTMPFIEGETLRDRLDREKQLPVPDALALVRQIGGALGYAHRQGVVHRDVKPENILLRGGQALVADFGIARAVSQAGGQKLTQTGMAIGTPIYMSPEQSMSDAIDGRADLYSLGCMLYELLVGEPPFAGSNPRALMARHSMEVVPSMQVVRATIPDAVEDAVMRALAKTPADRFATVEDFVAALDGAESGPATQRARTQTMTSLRRPRRRMGALQIGLLGVGLFAAAAGVWRFWSVGPKRAAAGGDFDPRRIAVLYFHDLGGGDSLRFLADGLTEGLIRELGQVNTLQVISRNGVAPYRGDSIPRDSIARALRVGTLVEGTVEATGGRLRITTRLIDGASGAEFRRASFDQPATGNLLVLGDSLSQEVARFLRERLGEEVRVRETREAAHNPDAWTLVQRADQRRKEADKLTASSDTAARARAFHSADSLLAQAEALDPQWAEPIIRRAGAAYQRSRLAGDDPLQASKWIDDGLGHVERALALAAENSDALELRGNLRYWRWLLGLESDPVKAQALLKAAQADLELAVKITPAQAGAWSTLSHMYANTTGSSTDVKLAAQRAYEADAYLSNADVVLYRLFLASYDLEQFPDAVNWCGEGARRFPGNYRFVECQSYLLTTRARKPDVAAAWKLADSLVKLAPAQDQAYQKRNGEMAVAAVLARAGLADSARAVARRAVGTPEIDPKRDLVLRQAFVYTLLGDRAQAVKSLKLYFAVNPERRAGMAEDAGWWFRSLQDDPGFQALVGSRRQP